MPTYPITSQLFSFCDILTDFYSLLLPRIVGFNGVGLYHFEVWLRWLNTVLAVCDYMSLPNLGRGKFAAHKLKLGK